jgi:hypothetical protein
MVQDGEERMKGRELAVLREVDKESGHFKRQVVKDSSFGGAQQATCIDLDYHVTGRVIIYRMNNY